MPLPVHWVNLQRSSSISILDRGFAYGDGVFETLRCNQGRLNMLDAHLLRLQNGCNRLHIPCPLDRVKRHLDEVSTYLKRHGIKDATLRLSVTRGSANNDIEGRGYGGKHGEPAITASLFPARLAWRDSPPAAHVTFSPVALAPQPLLAGIKHCNRLEQVLAARAAREAGVDEAVMLNTSGDAVCAIAANLFLVIGEQLLTPDLSACGVQGTVRGLLLEHLAANCALHVEQRPVASSELYQADELFLTNSLVGIQSISLLEQQQFPQTRVADTLRSAFFDLIDAEAA